MSLTCSGCSSTVSYSDNDQCATCGAGINISFSLPNTVDTGSDCYCDSYYDALVETDSLGLTNTGSKNCSTCPSGMGVVATTQFISGKEYVGDSYSCRSCPDSNMEMTISPSTYSSSTSPTYTCSCLTNYVQFDMAKIGESYCLYSASSTSVANVYHTNIDTLAEVTYQISSTGASKTVRSAVMKHYLPKAVVNCQFYSSAAHIRDCQTLANLCVLAGYDATNSACSVFADLLLVSGRSNNSFYSEAGWGNHLPWLYYSDSASNVCFDTSISMSVHLTNQHLQYKIASYTLNGTYLGTQDLGSLFAYCTLQAPNSGSGGGTGTSTQWQIFGSTELSTYGCDLTSLLLESGNNINSQRFYELFLVDSGNSDALYPVPVRLSGVLHPGFLCNNGDSLVRRFYLTDMISGIADDGTSSLTPSVMKYASNIILEVGIRNSNPSKIYSPILTVEYTTVDTTSIETTSLSSSSTTKYSFSALYTMDMGDFLSDMKKMRDVAISFTVILTALRLYIWHYRNFRSLLMYTLMPNGCGINMNTLINLGIAGMKSYVQIFFPLTVVLCWYWFVYFKLQRAVAVMFSPQYDYNDESSLYYPFVLHLHLMTLFQLVYVLTLINKQVSSDIFFIDWEPSAGNKTTREETATNTENKASVSQPNIDNSMNDTIQSPTADTAKVSIWRTILVANEWCELQTTRKTNVIFTLFFVGFFLLGLDLDYNATSQPDLNNTSAGQMNAILRFANTTFFWLILSYAQWLWKFCIYERYISEPPEQSFIDFCTIAKISVFVMDEKFHGYYLHCRSPHQYADGSMIELLDMLHKEESGLVVDRSFDSAPPDVQSFEIFASCEFRLAFDKVYNNLLLTTDAVQSNLKGNNVSSAAAGNSSTNTPGYNRVPNAHDNSSKNPYDALFKYWYELLTFLQEWIENNFNKNSLRHVIREKTYNEAFFGLPPDLSLPEQPSVFYPDPQFDYSSVLFLGRELDLLLLNILMYCLCDLWFNNTMLSMLLTYLLEQVLCFIRFELGKVCLLYIKYPRLFISLYLHILYMYV